MSEEEKNIQKKMDRSENLQDVQDEIKLEEITDKIIKKKEQQEERGEKQESIDDTESSSAQMELKEIKDILNKYMVGTSEASRVQNLYFIKENSGIIAGDQADFKDIYFDQDISMEKNLKYSTSEVSLMPDIFKNEKTLSAWMTEHYHDFEMAYLLSLAVFQDMPYLWIYDAAEKLYDLWVEDEDKNSLDKEKMPNDQRLQQIGGKRYIGVVYNHMGKVESEFTGFEKSDYAEKVLRCAWTQFFFGRRTLLTWLNSYVSDRNYSKSIRAIDVMAIFAENNFDYFIEENLKLLYGRKEFLGDFAIARILSKLYKEERYCDNIDKIFWHWSTVGNVHYSLTALLMSIMNEWEQSKVEVAVEGYLNNLLSNIFQKKGEAYLRELPAFFAIGERKAVYFKAIVKALYQKLLVYDKRIYQTEKRLVGVVFFWLLQIDDQQSHIDVNDFNKNKDMIFVKMCLIHNETALQVQALWRFIWKNREMHGAVKEFLKKYLYQYGGCGKREIVYLRKFLYSFQDNQADKDEMEYFLKRLSLHNIRPIKEAEKINR